MISDKQGVNISGKDTSMLMWRAKLFQLASEVIDKALTNEESSVILNDSLQGLLEKFNSVGGSMKSGGMSVKGNNVHDTTLKDPSQNMLEGSLSIPPPSTLNYVVAFNKLSGQVSPAFCTSSSIQYIDFGHNKLSGTLPDCLVNLSDSLLVLNVSLNLGNNQLGDEFPSWLRTLPDLRILMIRSNHLHENIGKPISNFVFFPKIRVIDLSYDDFTGKLPYEYFQKWNSMKAFVATNSSYMKAGLNFIVRTSTNVGFMDPILSNPNHVDMVFYTMQDIFLVIDFSSNMLEGEIPDSIGSLQGIRVFNLSNNILNGSIPSTFGNMTMLESLNLSQNKLHGEIPLQLK
ncbi:receptor-like protein 35 [Ziziphus jujuba]|uniref:Receptor-like protein 35 n=1 Tax=Ziziphus jujuba TaxID=326968 RepID=A0ABM3ZRZ4_ZIZJJ|nr:receptor-like protein 35 [Ziziphus jujuba]